MAETTGITWADATWNPWIGCSPVSEGCDLCYARREMTRYGKDFSTVKRTSPATFNLPLKKKRDGSWKIPDGSFVFVCSWSDFFHEDVPFQWRQDAFCRMVDRPGLTFLLLTKRVDRIASWLDEWRHVLDGQHPAYPEEKHRLIDTGGFDHIWLGVTAENQARADERIPKLIEIDWPGKKFVSVEPMLGPVDIRIPLKLYSHVGPPCCTKNEGLHRLGHGLPNPPRAGLDWVICGGESGPGARPMEIQWARDLRDQCQTAGVPFHMKQLGGWPDKRKKLEDLPEDLRIRERP